MLELGTLKPINHKNSLKTLEDRIETHLELFEQAYANDVANSSENERAFELIHRSIRKCLRIDHKKRPDFFQLFGENVRNSMEKDKIKFFIAVKEKRAEELEMINWEEAKKPESSNNSEEIAQLKSVLTQKNQEIKHLREENFNLLKENENLREENNKLLREKNLEKKNLQLEKLKYFFRVFFNY